MTLNGANRLTNNFLLESSDLSRVKKQDMNFFDNDNIRLYDDYPNYKRIQAFDSKVTLKFLKNQPKIALYCQMTIDDIIPSGILFDES